MEEIQSLLVGIFIYTLMTMVALTIVLALHRTSDKYKGIWEFYPKPKGILFRLLRYPTLCSYAGISLLDGLLLRIFFFVITSYV